jgi:hypothetical protein
MDNMVKIYSGNGHILLSPTSEELLRQTGMVKKKTMETMQAQMEKLLVTLQQ